MTKEKTEEMPEMMEVDVLRKITPKTVLEMQPEKPKKQVWLIRVLGIIYDYKEGTTDLGPYIKFRGDFKALRLSDKVSFRSNIAIFPKPLDDVLAAQYLSTIDQETGEQTKKCQFAALIGIKPSTSPTGYDWVVKPLLEMKKQDALANLETTVAGLLPAK